MKIRSLLLKNSVFQDGGSQALKVQDSCKHGVPAQAVSLWRWLCLQGEREQWDAKQSLQMTSLSCPSGEENTYGKGNSKLLLPAACSFPDRGVLVLTDISSDSGKSLHTNSY